MRPPCELVQREFLPVLRSRLAKVLRERGFSQNQIAEHLEITQAAVSKYLKQPLETSLGSKALKSLVTELADHIVSGDVSSDALVKQVCSFCISLRIGSSICHRHRETVSSLGAIHCNICTDLFGGESIFQERAKILDDMERAVSLIEGASSFVRLLPQVRASLVACEANAETIEQVVGIPGRITDVGGRARAPAPPEYGASRHTASLLLWAKRIVPAARACLCISGDKKVLRSVEQVGYKIITVKTPTSETDKIAKGAEKDVKSLDSKSHHFAIYVPGGLEVEPVLYLFGSTATELAERAIEIAESLR